MVSILDRVGRLVLLACTSPAMVASAVLDVIAGEEERASLRADLERSLGVRDELRSELAAAHRAYQWARSEVADLESKVKSLTAAAAHWPTHLGYAPSSYEEALRRLRTAEQRAHVLRAVEDIIGCPTDESTEYFARCLVKDLATVYAIGWEAIVQRDCLREAVKRTECLLDIAREQRDLARDQRDAEARNSFDLKAKLEAVERRAAASERLAAHEADQANGLRRDLGAARDEIKILRGRLA